MRISHSITLSALLLSLGYGQDLFINGTQENLPLTGLTYDNVQLTGGGVLNVTSTGNSAIKNMQMYWLSNGAGASFTVNSGKLDLSLAMVNASQVQNNITFDVKNGATLNLTNNKNGTAHGIFQGLSTTLQINVAGTLDGNISNDNKTTLEISNGGKLSGGITQTGGELNATIEGTLEGSIIANKNVTKTSLWANQNNNNINTTTATITGNIAIEGGGLEGIVKGMNLQGSYTQTGGTSDIAFHHSKFQSATTLSDANTTIHFYSTKLKSISANNGTTTINLKGDLNTHTGGSTMEGYTGTGGNATINLIEGSSMQNASQSSGSLTITANASEIKGSVNGSNDASLTLNLSAQSTLDGSIVNNGQNSQTNLTSANSTITGSISQMNGTLQAEITNTQIQGSYNQTSGQLTFFKATNSRIQQGVNLSAVGQNGIIPQLDFSGSTIDKGLKVNTITGTLVGQFSNGSTINGGFEQTNRGRVSLTFNNSTLNDGVQVKNGGGIQNGNITNATSHATSLTFQNGSTLNGGVTSNNHSIWLNFTQGSQANNGNFSATEGDFYLVASENSTVNGNLTSQDTGETRLYLSGATFNGNITQTNGKQHISMVLQSTLTGDIKNSNTQSVFANDEGSTLQGNYTQDNGSLTMLLGGDSIITGDVLLNSVDTTLGNGTAQVHAETIQGSWTQNDGSLTGNIEGLTLEGKFTQNQGTSNITFGDADFKQETTINGATLTQILFDNNSNLKTTTLNNSTNPDNIFTLDHITTLDGDFILNHSKVTLGVKNGSKITGSIKSSDADNDLKLDFEGTDNEIGGDLEIKNGNLEGDLTGTTVNGKINLEDATTHLHIVDSTVNGGISILRGSTLLTIEGSTIGTGFTMSGVDKNGGVPTLGLSFSNGSTIDGNLNFENTNVAFGGFGDGNSITGSLISTNSTLISGGDNFNQAGHAPAPTSASGLTINGELKQNGGTFDLTFSNKSSIIGATTLDNGDQSHLTLDDSSLGTLTVNQGKDNYILLRNQSTQNGAISFVDTKVTLEATTQSSLEGDITSTTPTAQIQSDTTILLNNSSLTGNITQSDGVLLMKYSNNSSMIGSLTANNLTDLKVQLESSSITGNLTITNTPTEITMQNGSLISGDLILGNNPQVTINANASTLEGGITHTGNIGDNVREVILNFNNNSTLNNTTTTIQGEMQIASSDSQINSTGGIDITLGSLNLSLSNSTGTIERITTGGTNSISISTTNFSNSAINLLELKDNATLTLVAQNRAILSGNLDLNATSSTTITSLGNANLKINITPESTTNLTISLNGGIMQGMINQNQNLTGLMTLASSGQYGGRWLATGDSSIKELSISNASGNISNRAAMQANSFDSVISLIDTTYNADSTSRVGLSLIGTGTPDATQTLARTVRIGSLIGSNGVFRVYTDIGAEQSDKISAASASGSHIMQVYYNPATFTDNIVNKYIVVAHVDDAQTTANFQGGEVDMGNQTYKTSLIKVASKDGVGFDWILGSTQNLGPTYGTKVISSILQSQYRSYAIQTESLRQRMGELRDINRVHGLWGRYNMGSNYTAESDVGVEIIDNYYNAWIGYDQNVLDLKGQNFYGIALSYALVAPEGKDYQGQIHNFGINLYDTFIARNDFYMDFVLKYILTYADYEIDYYSLAKNKPSYFNHKVMLSAEFGKKFKLTDSKSYFFLQPEGQITAGYIFGNTVSFTDASQTTIEANLSGDAPVILRTGLTAGYSLNSSSFKADFYAGTSIFYETSTGGDVELNDGNSTVSYNHKGDFRMSIQGGFDLIFNDNARVYFEAGTSFMGPTQNVYSINAGARFAFGYKNTRKLKVPSSTPPPPPPKTEYDPRNIPVITDNTSEDIRNNNSAKPRKQGYDSDYFINTRKFYRDRTSVTNNPKPTY